MPREKQTQTKERKRKLVMVDVKPDLRSVQRLLERMEKRNRCGDRSSLYLELLEGNMSYLLARTALGVTYRGYRSASGLCLDCFDGNRLHRPYVKQHEVGWRVGSSDEDKDAGKVAAKDPKQRQSRVNQRDKHKLIRCECRLGCVVSS